MKKILSYLLILICCFSLDIIASKRAQYLVDAGISGYLMADIVRPGSNPLLKLEDTEGHSFLTPMNDCKIIAESLESIDGFNVNDEVRYTLHRYNSNVEKTVRLLKLFSNKVALISIKNDRNEDTGFDSFVDTKDLRHSDIKID